MSENISRRLDCKEFCANKYSAIYNEYMTGKRDNKGNKAKARKAAIGGTALQALKAFPDINPEDIWHMISRMHMQEFAGVDLELDTLDAIVSARQSWVKSSGHAFEEMVKAECNKYLSGTNMKVLLQRDLSSLINANKVTNGSMDITWLKQQCKTDVFDLYVSRVEGDTYKIFGCIQAKTSVRDRVGRDLPASKVAMEKHFWSTIFIFDASFLHQPKFTAMVNGNINYDEYSTNGWHQAYSYDSSFNEDRIKYLGLNMEAFVSDAIRACEDFTGENRSWLNNTYTL